MNNTFRRKSNRLDNSPKQSGLANIPAIFDYLSVNPLTLLFGESIGQKSTKEIDDSYHHYHPPFSITMDRNGRCTNSTNTLHHIRPSDTFLPPDLYDRPNNSSNLQSATIPPSRSPKQPSLENSCLSNPLQSPHVPKAPQPRPADLNSETQNGPHPSASTSQSSSVTLTSSPPSTAPSKKRKPRLNRNFSRRNPWELHYHYLNQRLPPFVIPDRDDPYLHSLWLQHCSKHRYCRRRRSRLLQNLRLAFISAQRVRLARENHSKIVMRSIERSRKYKSYQLAYLKFKRERIELLTRLGKIEKTYKMGWTPFKEWKAWRQVWLSLREREGKKYRRRRSKKRLVMDEAQHRAERRIFEDRRVGKGVILPRYGVD